MAYRRRDIALELGKDRRVTFFANEQELVRDARIVACDEDACYIKPLPESAEESDPNLFRIEYRHLAAVNEIPSAVEPIFTLATARAAR